MGSAQKASMHFETMVQTEVPQGRKWQAQGNRHYHSEGS